MKRINIRAASSIGVHLLEEAGFVVTTDPMNSDYVLIESELECAAASALFDAQGIVNIDVNIHSKQYLAEKLSQLGYATIPMIAITSRADIENAPFERMFSKPTVGVGGMSPSAFDYVTYASKAEALAAFDADTSGSLQYRKPILQPSYADQDGNTSLLMVNVAVNGTGQIHIEPLVVAQFSELSAVKFHSSLRGCNEDIQGAEEARALTAALIASLGLRNTYFKLQFVWTGDGYLPMDASYRLDYALTYILPKAGSNHPQGLLRFMFDEDAAVTTSFDYVSQMRMVNIHPDVSTSMVVAALAEFGVIAIPTFRSDRTCMFGKVGASKAEVLESLDLFSQRIG